METINISINGDMYGYRVLCVYIYTHVTIKLLNHFEKKSFVALADYPR
jgi:hypothetical protein